MKKNNKSLMYKSFNASSIVPKFPPEISALNLVQKAISRLESSGKTSRIPNAFIAYRMAFCKELQRVNHPVFTQPQLSSMAKSAWNKEPESVQKTYRYISAEASEIYKKLCKNKYHINIDYGKETTNQFECYYVLGKEKDTDELTTSSNSSLHGTNPNQNRSEYEDYFVDTNLAFKNKDRNNEKEQLSNSSLDLFPQLEYVDFFPPHQIEENQRENSYSILSPILSSNFPYDYNRDNFFSLSLPLHTPTVENPKQCTCSKNEIIKLESKIEELENKLKIVTKNYEMTLLGE
ncbi:9895_t:CDS:1 [Ambispora leptoticha]|uniref:9895_t:CDS:1 n=1 Tax=Ambispora leptoticha TaxID=144679 RepID=A0A9N8YRT8_9GLOM|nr:9895_t:CDS:1 [Ambispora leptoticha]